MLLLAAVEEGKASLTLQMSNHEHHKSKSPLLGPTMCTSGGTGTLTLRVLRRPWAPWATQTVTKTTARPAEEKNRKDLRPRESERVDTVDTTCELVQTGVRWLSRCTPSPALRRMQRWARVLGLTSQHTLLRDPMTGLHFEQCH